MFYPPVLHYVDEDGLFYYRAFPKLLMIEFVLNQVQDRLNRKKREHREQLSTVAFAQIYYQHYLPVLNGFENEDTSSFKHLLSCNVGKETERKETAVIMSV